MPDPLLADLSASDKAIVDQFLDSREQLTDLVPDAIDPATLWTGLSACCRSLALNRRTASLLKIVIGRMLVVLRDRPEVYQNLGYRTFDDFITRGMPELFGIPRSEAYAARTLVEKWPSLSAEQIKLVSYSKLALISKVVDEKSSNANMYLKAAQEHTLDQLKDILANNGVLPREDSDFATITILTTKGIKKMWTDAVSDPQIRAYCQTDDPGVILECLLSETLCEWRSRMLLQMQEVDAKWVPRKV